MMLSMEELKEGNIELDTKMGKQSPKCLDPHMNKRYKSIGRTHHQNLLDNGDRGSVNR